MNNKTKDLGPLKLRITHILALKSLRKTMNCHRIDFGPKHPSQVIENKGLAPWTLYIKRKGLV
jgi:hypothetical protein